MISAAEWQWYLQNDLIIGSFPDLLNTGRNEEIGDFYGYEFELEEL